MMINYVCIITIILTILTCFTCVAKKSKVDAPGCNFTSVYARGAWYQTNRMGSYVRRENDYCDGRHVYEQHKGWNLMYYAKSPSGFSGWMIGMDKCLNIGGVSIHSNATTPDKATGVWQEVNWDRKWIQNENIQVVCSKVVEHGLSSLQITFIVLGALVGFIVFLALLCVIVNKCQQLYYARKRGRSPESRPNNTSATEVGAENNAFDVSEIPPPIPFAPPFTVPEPPLYEHIYDGPPPAYAAKDPATEEQSATATVATITSTNVGANAAAQQISENVVTTCSSAVIPSTASEPGSSTIATALNGSTEQSHLETVQSHLTTTSTPSHTTNTTTISTNIAPAAATTVSAGTANVATSNNEAKVQSQSAKDNTKSDKEQSHATVTTIANQEIHNEEVPVSTKDITPVMVTDKK